MLIHEPAACESPLKRVSTNKKPPKPKTKQQQQNEKKNNH